MVSDVDSGTNVSRETRKPWKSGWRWRLAVWRKLSDFNPDWSPEVVAIWAADLRALHANRPRAAGAKRGAGHAGRTGENGAAVENRPRSIRFQPVEGFYPNW